MTTQIPYGPAGADYPQFAAGHAQYPPAGYQHPVHHAAPHHAAPQHPAAQQPVADVPAQVPHQQPHPPSAYPTAPPWATQAQAPAPAAPGSPATAAGPGIPAHAAGPGAPGTAHPDAAVMAPYGYVPQVGGLLVPYPEEIRNAARAQAPSAWPVAAFTFFFSVFGAISATRRADRARYGRNGVAKYWITFVVTLVVGAFFWNTVVANVVVPLYLQVREGATVKSLEDNVLHDGQLAKANVSASKADCRPAGEWAGGKREYLCELTLNNGKTGRVLVTADSQGNWKSLEKR
ncbi:hypothetical protein AB0368_24300 [Actinoplanes sp. NPDC051475]|uniref:hypothetical protein n=1 Tax=Actinoplanes sp. NPDC051475 TaxID=3157225 RepID=UPI00344E8B2F